MINKIIGDDFRGCVLICKSNEILFEKAYGYADLPNEVPNQCDTKFATASAGKVFVAVGILQLIEQGLLHFDDKISKILDFDLKQIDPNITIEQLLTHTSGIPDYFDESLMDDYKYEDLWIDYPNYKIRSNKDLIPLFIDKPMLYPAGSKFQYNNTGFVVLALIIEKITGLDFDQYLYNHIFNPCGMYNTGYYELDRLPAKCAINYIYDEDRKSYRTNIFSVDAKGTGAGGAFTTVGDIKLFWEGLISHRLLSASMTKDMLSYHSGDDDDYYGYGIWLTKSNDRYIPYFTGCDPGVSFVSLYDTEKQLMAVLISNYGDDVWEMMRDIKKALL